MVQLHEDHISLIRSEDRWVAAAMDFRKEQIYRLLLEWFTSIMNAAATNKDRALLLAAADMLKDLRLRLDAGVPRDPRWDDLSNEQLDRLVEYYDLASQNEKGHRSGPC
jgi:hypothetical protein